MNALITYALFVSGIILLVKSGDFFVDSASYFARATGLPEFAVGATVVSFGTTLPEIIVSSIAAFDARRLYDIGLYEKALNKVGMAVGNGIGSVIANTALIMAISIVFMPADISDNAASFLKKSSILVAGVCGLWGITFFTGELRPWGSVLLMTVFIVFMRENIISSKNQKNAVEDMPDKSSKTFIFNIVHLVSGAAGIMIGSHLLVKYGSIIASRFGVPESVIGLTAVAAGTSLPELVTALSAVVRKKPSLSVGNIIGANIIDVTLILPVSSFVYSHNLPVSFQNRAIDFPVCILVTFAALLPAFIRKKFCRLQGILLLAIYSLYIAAVCYFR